MKNKTTAAVPVLTENSVRSENAEVPIIREIMVAATMSSLLVALFALVASSFRTRAALQAEVLALRHQLAVFQKNAPGRLRLRRSDRFLWVLLSRFWSGWRRCLARSKYSSRSLPSATTHRSAPVDDKSSAGGLLPGEIPRILNICADCGPIARCPIDFMPLASRNTSAGRPVVLDTALLPRPFLPRKAMATKNVAHRLIGQPIT